MIKKILTLALFSTTLLSAQVNLPRQSPAATVSQTFAYTTATVNYGRPEVRGRTIWGGLVPYGQVWRAGANEATTIEFATDVRINGNPLPKGKYALFVLPVKEGASDAWTFIFDTNPDVWGAFSYDGKHDALRVTVKPSKIPNQERLEYGFESVTDSSAVLSLRWEKLQASLLVSAEFLQTAQKNILADLPAKTEPFSWMNAARFYRTYAIDSAQAYAWIDKSIAIKPMYQNLWSKAEWLAEDKQYAEAVQTGRKAWLEAAKDPMLESQLPMLDKKLKAWGKKDVRR